MRKLLVQYRWLFLLVFFLNLPCSTKQEFKKALDIPLTEVAKKEKQQNICTSSNHWTHPHSEKKETTSDGFSLKLFGENSLATIKNRSIATPLLSPTAWKSPKVPLFILHERYRI